MLDLTLLGTGGMMPLPGRFLTALMVRHKGESLLIDCGEGTQVAIRSAKLGFKSIAAICITHFHADHIAGLPGLLLTIGHAGRTQTLRLIGPPNLQHVVEKLCVIAPELPFPIVYHEIDEQYTGLKVGELRISAIPVEHRIPCYCYKFELERPGRFDVEKAKMLRLPMLYWSVLQRGETVEFEGKRIHPADVLGEKRKGIQVCYATDLRASSAVVDFARDSDVFICEGIYGNPDKQDKAILYKHCMFSEAAQMAQCARVKELWLTHFSPSLKNPAEELHYATEYFENTFIDKKNTTVRFE